MIERQKKQRRLSADKITDDWTQQQLNAGKINDDWTPTKAMTIERLQNPDDWTPTKATTIKRWQKPDYWTPTKATTIEHRQKQQQSKASKIQPTVPTLASVWPQHSSSTG